MWNVTLHPRVEKSLKKYPFIVKRVRALVKALKIDGPYLYQWAHFSKLTGEKFHCWIKNGSHVMVAVWIVIEEKNKKLEVTHVTTHENAPY